MNYIEKQLSTILARSWWVLLLRGLAAIAFGIITWTMPGISLTSLILMFGAYTLVDGILGVGTAISGRKGYEGWWVLLLWAIIGIGVGIFTLLAPGLTAIALLMYIAGWAIATGVLQIAAAIRLRKEIVGEWWLILAGVASIIFGAFLIAQPGAGILTLLWLLATYAVVLGVLLVLLSFKVRSFSK